MPLPLPMLLASWLLLVDLASTSGKPYICRGESTHGRRGVSGHSPSLVALCFAKMEVWLARWLLDGWCGVVQGRLLFEWWVYCLWQAKGGDSIESSRLKQHTGLSRATPLIRSPEAVESLFDIPEAKVRSGQTSTNVKIETVDEPRQEEGVHSFPPKLMHLPY
ncbi:hypothetical protein BDP55DRAFT_737102 [Colletotrichum godetiae]|uniref:Secreted protein n=1 Tax=Colletotrichum godetiae TaxID=1209918 RepID=A0AAJ0ASG3_9PEZI|nr:uncharacterized protein BDP55DRAFT_737102 [Colletotrichum godetiae]KAK1688802.1 hypothetical protein BDP55DRAFT_737102 [Colletotrichum godetiae]